MSSNLSCLNILLALTFIVIQHTPSMINYPWPFLCLFIKQKFWLDKFSSIVWTWFHLLFHTSMQFSQSLLQVVCHTKTQIICYWALAYCITLRIRIIIWSPSILLHINSWFSIPLALTLIINSYTWLSGIFCLDILCLLTWATMLSNINAVLSIYGGLLCIPFLDQVPIWAHSQFLSLCSAHFSCSIWCTTNSIRGYLAHILANLTWPYTAFGFGPSFDLCLYYSHWCPMPCLVQFGA